METQHLNSVLFLLSLLIFGLCGCTSKEQPFFKLQAEGGSVAPTKNLLFLIQDSASPSSINSTLVLEESKIPDGSLYLDITQGSADSSLFQLNIKAKNLVGVYDTPLTIEYDPSFVEPELSAGYLQLTEGPQVSRLRKAVEPSPQAPRVLSLIGARHPNDNKRLVLAHSLLTDIGLQTYTGTLFTISMKALSSGPFRTIIGIDLVGSELYDQSGSRIPASFFGGILTREL